MAGKLKGAKDGKPFTKGDPRINRKGRPKKLPELDVFLADILGEEKAGVTAAPAILNALRKKAASGDVRAIEVMLDRAYGKSRQFLDISAEVNTIKIIRE